MSLPLKWLAAQLARVKSSIAPSPSVSATPAHPPIPTSDQPPPPAATILVRGETLLIRDAVPADIPALAALHVKTWNATYPGVESPPTYTTREGQWRKAFANVDGTWFCFVVQRDDGELVGFAKGRRSDHPDYGGELNKIYLLREYQRIGIGRRLVGLVARRFLAQGISSMWLFGDPQNPSRAAWKALGAIKTDDDPNTGNYAWPDLHQLAAICPTD